MNRTRNIHTDSIGRTRQHERGRNTTSDGQFVRRVMSIQTVEGPEPRLYSALERVVIAAGSFEGRA